MARAISPAPRLGKSSGRKTTMILTGLFIVRKRKILIVKENESSIEI
jgi:hypothetical protein